MDSLGDIILLPTIPTFPYFVGSSLLHQFKTHRRKGMRSMEKNESNHAISRTHLGACEMQVEQRAIPQRRRAML
jgi:hypothetical protein